MPKYRLTYTREVDADTEAAAVTFAQEMAAQSFEDDWTVEDASDPSTEEAYTALEEAIAESCDDDTRNDISDAYRDIMRERGFNMDDDADDDNDNEGGESEG